WCLRLSRATNCPERRGHRRRAARDQAHARALQLRRNDRHRDARGMSRNPELLRTSALIAAVFLGAVDQTAIVTTLPAIVVDLQIPFDRIDQAAWIVSGYLLGYTVALPLMGRFADLRGHRTSLMIALGVFALGSLGCALSGSLGVLVVSRLVQAAGGGALVPVAV